MERSCSGRANDDGDPPLKPSDVFTELSSQLGLGELTGGPERMLGGLIHDVSSFSTSRGRFVAKRLNSRIIMRDGAPRNYLDSERIALAMVARGIPAIAALRADTDPLIHVGGDTFLVYRRIDAKALDVENVTVAHCAAIGGLLARMHAAGDDIRRKLTSDDSQRGEEGAVLSHRDLDIKNVLWQAPDAPVAIDWESAGSIRPLEELVAAAIDWSGLREDKRDEARVRALMQAYKRAMTFGKIDASDMAAAFAYFVGGTESWLAFIREGADGAESDIERTQTRDEIAATERILQSLDADRDWWVETLSSAIGNA